VANIGRADGASSLDEQSSHLVDKYASSSSGETDSRVRVARASGRQVPPVHVPTLRFAKYADAAANDGIELPTTSNNNDEHAPPKPHLHSRPAFNPTGW